MFLSAGVFLHAQMKQAEGQSEAAKQRELQRKIEQLKAEISHLDSQISGTEEQLATQGQFMSCSEGYFLLYKINVVNLMSVMFTRNIKRFRSCKICLVMSH